MSQPNLSLKNFNRKLFLLGFFKIPMIWYVKPRLLELNEERVKVKIRLRRRTKNHLNSMYFGALAVGADVAAGIFAFYFAELLGKKVSFAFKGINGNFLKRAESDIVFVCEEGNLVQKAMDLSLESGERVNETVKVIAYNTYNEAVAEFDMIVSVKVKG